MRLKLSSVKNIAIFSGSIALAAAIALPTGSVHAQVITDTWKDGVMGNWSAGTNWVGNVAPTPGNTTSLFFNNATTTAYMATNDIANPFSLNSLTLNNSNAGNTGLITLAGSQINFDGTNPTLNFNGIGNATVTNNLMFDATSVIGGTGTGTLTLSGTITNSTSPATYLSVNDANGTVNFTGNVNLNRAIPSTIDNTGGGFFVTNGTVNASGSITAYNLFYVGDSISSLTNLTTGAGTTGNGANGTLNVSGNVIQYGRFAIGALTGDKGTLNIASGGSLVVSIANIDMGNTNPTYFNARLQVGGQGGSFDTSNNQVYGTANSTASAATINLTGGQLAADTGIEMYTNGRITATNGSVIHAAAVADGNLPAGGVGGISLTNSSLFLEGPRGTFANVIYSGNITGTGGTITKQDIYTQILAGNNTMTGTISENGGVLAITGNTVADVNIKGLNTPQGGSTLTGTLNVTGTASGTITLLPAEQTSSTGGNTLGNLSGTGTVGAIVLKSGTVSPGGTASTATGIGAVGTLNGKSLTWSSAASALNFDLNLASNTTGDDLLNLSTFFNSDVANPAAKAYTFNFTTSGTFSGAPTTYNLVDYQTGQTNFIANDFTATGIPGGLLGVFSFNGANNILQFTVSAALPEPSALPFALVGLAPVGFMAFSRARRRAADARLSA